MGQNGPKWARNILHLSPFISIYLLILTPITTITTITQQYYSHRLGDRVYEKRKNAALEIEALIKILKGEGRG
jgi:hypothetical protein